jgi:acyl-CoA thioesterase-1
LSNRLAQYAGALLLLQGLGGCSNENNPAAEPTSMVATSAAASWQQAADAPLVVAFGDSLYAGYGLGPKESFPAKLEKALKAKGIAVTISNAGVSGNTTAEAQRRLAFTLDGFQRKPDLMMVNLGGNDMLRGIDPKETRANLTAICEELKRRGIPILLTGMIAAPNMGADYADRFNAIYPDLAKKYDAALYPFFLEGVVTNPKLMQADRVHPTAQGIDVIVGNIEPLVEKKLAAD